MQKLSDYGRILHLLQEINVEKTYPFPIAAVGKHPVYKL